MANEMVIVVTGTSRGVGKGIVELLAKQELERPLIIYATSRSGVDANIPCNPRNEIRYRKLDITHASSIQAFFAAALKEVASIDVLMNNAAVSNDYRETPQFAAETIWNNYGGTRDMCKAFLAQPNLKPGSRVVNTTSGYNHLSTYGTEIQEQFRTATTISDLDTMATAYLDAVQQGQDTQQQAGWGTGARSYKVSKALINALTVVLAKQYPGIMVNCCCPGWVNTDMGNQANGKPPKTPEEGARIPTRLAIGDLGVASNEDGGLGRTPEKLSGMFFENDVIIDRGWGKSKVWLGS